MQWYIRTPVPGRSLISRSESRGEPPGPGRPAPAKENCHDSSRFRHAVGHCQEGVCVCAPGRTQVAGRRSDGHEEGVGRGSKGTRDKGDVEDKRCLQGDGNWADPSIEMRWGYTDLPRVEWIRRHVVLLHGEFLLLEVVITVFVVAYSSSRCEEICPSVL